MAYNKNLHEKAAYLWDIGNDMFIHHYSEKTDEKKNVISCRLPKSMIDRLKAAGEANNTAVSTMLTEFIYQGLIRFEAWNEKRQERKNNYLQEFDKYDEEEQKNEIIKRTEELKESYNFLPEFYGKDWEEIFEKNYFNVDNFYKNKNNLSDKEMKELDKIDFREE